MMRQLIRILEETLTKSDPRWASFGLNLPVGQDDAGQSGECGYLRGGADHGELRSGAAGNALSVEGQGRGVDENFRLGKSSPTTDAILTGIAAGFSVDVMVQAVNRTLQGVPSATVRVTIPLAQIAAPQVALTLPVAVESEQTVGTNANGPTYRNGNGAHATR